jgi:hypothetical protein
MEITDIKRTLIGGPPSIGDGGEDVLAAIVRSEAESLLGYRAGVKTPGEEPAGKPLRQALRELQIEVLNVHDVQDYMLQKLYETVTAMLAHERATGAVPLALSQDPGNGWLNRMRWEEEALSHYDGDVPDYVLNKAVSLKRACPEVEFVVVHLTETTDPFLLAYVRDPRYSWKRAEAYVIEAWDEAGF